MTKNLALILLLMQGCAVQSQPPFVLSEQMLLSFASDDLDFLGDVPLITAANGDPGRLRIVMYGVQPRDGQELSFRDGLFDSTLRELNPDLSWESLVRVNQDDEKLWVFVGYDPDLLRLEEVTVFRLDRSDPAGDDSAD